MNLKNRTRRNVQISPPFVDSMVDYAIFRLDANGCIDSWNRGAERIVGYQRDEIMGRHVSLLYPEEDVKQGRPDQVLQAAARDGRHWEQGWRLRKGGARFWAEAASSAFHHARGRLRGFGQVLRDAGERKNTEDALREITEEFQTFAHSLHHDLRAPLRSMCSFSQIVLQECGESLAPQSRELLAQVIRAAQRQDTLLRDLLAFCDLRTRQIGLEPVALEELTRDVIHERPDLQPPQVDIRIESPLLPMRGHPGFLTQCVSHLLENAAKFGSPGKKLVIRVWTQSLGQDVRLWVEDNGIGIPADEQQRIFGIFERLHYGETYSGTGIGLAIVRKAVARMGGTVGVESKAREGSKFWIQLPRGA